MTHLRRLGDPLARLGSGLARVLDGRGDADLETVQRCGIVHLYNDTAHGRFGLRLGWRRGEESTNPVACHEFIDRGHVVANELQHSFVLREQARARWRVPLGGYVMWVEFMCRRTGEHQI